MAEILNEGQSELPAISNLGINEQLSPAAIADAFTRTNLLVYHAFDYQFGIKNTPDNNLIQIPEGAVEITYPYPDVGSGGLALRARDMFAALDLRPADLAAVYSKGQSLGLDENLPPGGWQDLGEISLPDQNYYSGFLPSGGQTLVDLLDKKVLFKIKPRYGDHVDRHLVVPQREVRQFFDEATQRFTDFMECATKEERKFARGYRQYMDTDWLASEMLAPGGCDEGRAMRRKAMLILRNAEKHVPSAEARDEIIKLVIPTNPRKINLQYVYFISQNPDSFLEDAGSKSADVENGVIYYPEIRELINTSSLDESNIRFPFRLRRSFIKWIGYKQKERTRNIPGTETPGIWIDPNRLLKVHTRQFQIYGKSIETYSPTTRTYFCLNPNASEVNYPHRFSIKDEFDYSPESKRIEIKRGKDKRILRADINGLWKEINEMEIGQDYEHLQLIFGQENPSISYNFHLMGRHLRFEWQNGILGEIESINNYQRDPKGITGSNGRYMINVDRKTFSVTIPTTADATELTAKLIDAELLENTFNADPRLDKSWRVANFAEVLGIKIEEVTR